MPGMGGMPGPGMLGMGQSPMGGMDALMGASMGGRGEQALKDAAMAVGIALGDAYNRSAKAATLLSKALTLINQARQELQQASESAVGSPPELLGAMMGQSP